MTTLTVNAAEGLVYYVRVHPPAAGSSDSGTLDLSNAARVYPLQVHPAGGQMALPPITDTPTWISVNVSNATPYGELQFTIDASPTVIATADLDPAGQAIGTPILLDETILAGDHTITATDVATGKTGVLTITVVNGPADRPPAVGSNAPPTPVVTTQWVLENSGVEVYVFPTNPARMSSPNAQRVMTVEHSTAPDGQPMTFEGMPLGVSWTFEGNVTTQAHYEALERFLGYHCRLWLTDHLGRAWIIALESIDFTEVRSLNNPWSYSYKAKALILGGPVTP